MCLATPSTSTLFEDRMLVILPTLHFEVHLVIPGFTHTSSLTRYLLTKGDASLITSLPASICLHDSTKIPSQGLLASPTLTGKKLYQNTASSIEDPVFAALRFTVL